MNAAAARQLTTAYRANRLARRMTPALAVAKALRTAGAVTVADYLTEVRHLAGGVLRSVQGTFGKRVKALAAELGITTTTVPDFTQTARGIREFDVMAYAPADAVRLFTAIWDAQYAN